MRQNKLPAPLLVPALLWCLGICLGKATDVPFLLWLALAAGVAVSAFLLRSQRTVFLLLLCLVLGALRFVADQKPSALDQVFLRQNHIQQDANFMVTKLLSREAGIYEIRLEELAGVRIREPLSLFSQSELKTGQLYSALLEVLPGKQDPVLDTYTARHRAYVRQNLSEVPRAGRFLPIAAWRVRLLEGLEAKLGADAGFAKALLLSDTSAKGMYRDKLTRSGMVHLIVVSGLHVWFVYAICMVLLNSFLPRRWGEAVFLVLIALYAALNHWSPAVVRAALMIGIMIIARWRSIPMAGAQLLALSLLVITVVSPNQLFNIGLQLSFLCIGVIILALPRITWIKERALPNDSLRLRLSRILDLLFLNLIVGLSILPLTLFYFGTGSLNGILGNVIGIPLSGLLLTLSFLVLFLPGGNFLGAAFVSSYRLVLLIFEAWMEWVAKLPFYLENTWINGWQLLGGFLLVFALLNCLKNMKFRWQILPFASLGLLLAFLPGLKSRPEGGIYVFNSGTADCILVRLTEGTNLLVDTGPRHWNAERSWASRKLLPWMQRKGIGKLDWMVLTHLDADHSGGFEDLASAHKLRNLIVTDETMRDPKWLDWEQTGLLEGVNVHCVTDTVTFAIQGAKLKFLHPDRSFFPVSSNASSLLFRMDYQDKRYLFTGDADTDAEAHLLLHYPEELKADYLKAGHHGSRTSSSREFVRAVRPDEVWITASARNQWGFPHPEPLDAFRRYAKRIRSTSEGTIYVPFAQKD
ncbi:MAG: DNA internalization-related competence protein ComEC/Rec2 [Candidatus Syntrophosphaera sp.]|nr:DNA internalization-related competence protein ComEC/Rec2 [Candidatus Syntrophosphaera sp.]